MNKQDTSSGQAVVRRRPWLKQPEIYIEKGGWEELSDFESWLREKLGEDLAETYDALDPIFQTNLYGIFCDIADNRI